MSDVPFEKECENPLGRQSGFGEHCAFIVGVHPVYRFNKAEVRGVVDIQMPDCKSDLEQWRAEGDFRDNNTYAEIQTTAEGARLLAALLLEAANAADAVAGEIE